MKIIDIYYQGEGVGSLEHLELDAEETFAALQAAIARKHNIAGEIVLFIEDEAEPVEGDVKLRDKADRAGIKTHVHRCSKIEVVIYFKDKTVRHEFAPGATIARIKNWVTVRKFGMTEEEASHHHLQIAGTTDQPDPGTHIGTLASCPKCSVAFDLVTTPKVNGWEGA
jgi:Ser-tRNA(Ala) deacylase AlaX